MDAKGKATKEVQTSETKPCGSVPHGYVWDAGAWRNDAGEVRQIRSGVS